MKNIKKIWRTKNFLTLYCSVSWNMCNESLENIYQNTMQDNEQYKEVNIDKEKIYLEELKNSESVNVYYNTNTKVTNWERQFEDGRFCHLEGGIVQLYSRHIQQHLLSPKKWPDSSVAKKTSADGRVAYR